MTCDASRQSIQLLSARLSHVPFRMRAERLVASRVPILIQTDPYRWDHPSPAMPGNSATPPKALHRTAQTDAVADKVTGGVKAFRAHLRIRTNRERFGKAAGDVVPVSCDGGWPRKDSDTHLDGAKFLSGGASERGRRPWKTDSHLTLRVCLLVQI